MHWRLHVPCMLHTRGLLVCGTRHQGSPPCTLPPPYPPPPCGHPKEVTVLYGNCYWLIFLSPRLHLYVVCWCMLNDLS